ncbi:unnamed protein product [Rotaria magnacalcarata]|uniref:Endonuclease/exonuclease/phosphatase domain-containing protein n=1 Tax=Rotaria magnacalcarata TaxID=392030 RepID=A0A816XQ61_9BILA|nr:unnamed protein product [Rotaria magnacalcarata]
MGDLNARLDGNQHQLASTNNVGPFTVGVENENEMKLVDLCEINNIIVSNTGDRSIRRTTIRRDQFVAINSSHDHFVAEQFVAFCSSQINSFRAVDFPFVLSL